MRYHWGYSQVLEAQVPKRPRPVEGAEAEASAEHEREEGDEDELADWLRHVIDEDVAEEEGEEAAAEEVLLSQAR